MSVICKQSSHPALRRIETIAAVAVIGMPCFILLSPIPVLASTANHAVNPNRNVPAGTLTYKIVYTGQATVRSAEKNAADIKEAQLSMKAVANADRLHRIVTGSIHLTGYPLATNRLADEAQKKAVASERAAEKAKTEKAREAVSAEQGQVWKSMHGDAQACKSAANKKTCMLQAMMGEGNSIQGATPEQEAKAQNARNRSVRFNVWFTGAPCRWEIKLNDKESGVTITGAHTASGNAYHLSTRDKKTLDCPSMYTRIDGGPVIMVGDVIDGTYDIAFPVPDDVVASATETYESAWNPPGEPERHSQGKSTVKYKVRFPNRIVLRGLKLPDSGYPVKGKKVLDSVGKVKLMNWTIPVKAVVTWTFTPDKHQSSDGM